MTSTIIRRATALAALSVFALASACGGSADGPVQPSNPGTPTTPTTPSSPEAVASVTVSPASSSLIVGATTTLTATVIGTSGATLTGRTATWTTSDANIATVNGGVVTGVNAGTASITVTVEGKSAASAITVVKPQSASVEIVGGDQQRGLTGRALFDSLTIRTRSLAGQLAPGTVVTWSASSGALSTASTTTDVNGIARVQWTAGSGDATITASIPGSSSVTFHANGRASGSCTLTPGPTNQRFSLGPTDYTLSLRATSPHKIVVLFVDFPDAPATETISSLTSSIVDPGIALLKEMSYGRVNITTSVSTHWYRMSQASTYYQPSTFTGQRAYLLEAMQLADAEMDFSQADAVYLIASANAQMRNSPTFNVGQNPTDGITMDGKLFGNAVTFGQDSRRNGPAILAHETGHMFGLVDLYSFDPSAPGTYSGDQFRDVGAWSLMSNVFLPGHLLAWEKRKLGFIDDTQVDCIDGSGGVETIVQPTEVAGGTKMIAVPIDAAHAVAVEVRAKQGMDAALCSSGVLIYSVNSFALSGYDPVKMLGSRETTNGTAYLTCGPWADGTYGLGAGSVSTYTDADNGITVTVLAAEAGGAYRVRVKRN